MFAAKDKAGKEKSLSLAIVKSVVNQAKGFIEVESSPNNGTLFRIYLPRVKEEPQKVEAAPKPRKGGRILVVDDVEWILSMTRTFLQSAGYEVFVADSGEIALDILNQLSPPIDLVFTDYNLSGMTGRQLLEKVAQQWPNTKYVMTSGFIDDCEKQEIELEFHARVLEKPFNVNQVVELIGDLLSHRGS
jgi:CheY-like chemotaxis protein